MHLKYIVKITNTCIEDINTIKFDLYKLSISPKIICESFFYMLIQSNVVHYSSQFCICVYYLNKLHP